MHSVCTRSDRQAMVYMQMGVQRIFLDAADTTASKVWTSSTLGFTMIDEATFIPLCHQYTLVHNIRRNGLERCIKLIPSQEELMSQVLLPAYMLHASSQDCTPVCPTSVRLQPPPACLPSLRLPLQNFQENLCTVHSCHISVTVSSERLQSWQPGF